MTLNQLGLGATAKIVGIHTVKAERRRMFDLGIMPGTMIASELHSPLGDPTAYRVRDALVALRREQAELIEIVAEIQGHARK